MGPNRRRDSTSIGPSLLRRILYSSYTPGRTFPFKPSNFVWFFSPTKTTTPFLSLSLSWNSGGFNYRPMRSIAIFHSAPTFASLSAQQQIGNSFLNFSHLDGLVLPVTTNQTKREIVSSFYLPFGACGKRGDELVTPDSNRLLLLCSYLAQMIFIFELFSRVFLISFWVVWPNDKYPPPQKKKKPSGYISTSCAWCYMHIFSAFSKFSRESSPCVGYLGSLQLTRDGRRGRNRDQMKLFILHAGEKECDLDGRGHGDSRQFFFLFSCVYFFFFCRK